VPVSLTRAMVVSSALVTGSAALAQSKYQWDGTWSGTTNKGNPVEIVIAGEKVTTFSVKGEPQKVALSDTSGRGMNIIVSKGKSQETVRMIWQEPDKATYRWADLTGQVEDATLTRK
jgi:hypothetical protein